MPTNMLTNGSFESGLAGWTATGAGSPGVGVVLAPTNGITAGLFGDVVPSDAIHLGSNDPGGTHAAFFYDDNARDTLSQSVILQKGGVYQVGFDLWKTSSGAANSLPFTISASLGGQSVATAGTTTLATGSWTHYSTLIEPDATGPATLLFRFTAQSGGAGQDVMLDRVFVTDAPEPAGIAVFGVGMLALAGIRTFRIRQRLRIG